MARKRRETLERTLTPKHQLPTGHAPRRHTLVMRDKRHRKSARSSQRARGWND